MGETIWLDVPFEDKDAAKAAGARWNPDRRQWFAPRSGMAALQQWQARPELPTLLPGEDRTFGSGLFVDLVPESCWFTNVRSCVDKTDWDRLRRMIYDRADNQCEACGARRDPAAQVWLEAHERWSYDDTTRTQRLRRLVTLCSPCHLATHFGFAQISGKDAQALSQLMTINNWTRQAANDHVAAAARRWAVRSKHDWHLDLTMLTDAGVRLAQPRQGNQNPEIQILRYAVEGSFDTISYQIVERKQRLISQVMRGRLDARQVEDIGDAQLSMAETKAVASGDPHVLEKAEADKAVERYERLAKAHRNGQSAGQWKLQSAEAAIAQADSDEPVIAAAIARTVTTKGDDFHATLGRFDTDERTAAADHLQRYLTGASRGHGLRQAEDHGVVIRFGGHGFTVRQEPTIMHNPRWTFAIEDVPRTAFTIEQNSVGDGRGLITRFENRVAALPVILTTLQNDRQVNVREAEHARAQLAAPFKHSDALAHARVRQDDIRQKMTAARKAERAVQMPVAGDPPATEVA